MGHVSRDEALAHAASVADAVSVPISGDLENGYGHRGSDVAETITRAAAAGLAGCSIEDTALPDSAPYARAEAVARIEAAVSATRALSDDFVLVARADGVMNGQYDVAEAIARIQAFESGGSRLCLCADAPIVRRPGSNLRIGRCARQRLGRGAVHPIQPCRLRRHRCGSPVARIGAGPGHPPHLDRGGA